MCIDGFGLIDVLYVSNKARHICMDGLGLIDVLYVSNKPSQFLHIQNKPALHILKNKKIKELKK
jgi:hypothetical protein